MNTQLNRPLSIAVLQTRNGELPGFEDLYLLTCRNTMEDIRALAAMKLYGAIIGKAYYTGAIDLRQAIEEASR